MVMFHPDMDFVYHQVSKVSDWLDEEAGVETPLEEFTSRLKVCLTLLFIFNVLLVRC